MPVKVRCPDCKKVLTAPDRARGKVLKCPQCEGRVKVPVARPARKRPRPNDDDLLAGLDLRQAEDRSTRICPKCATVVGEEDVECPNCGVNVDTGVLSEKQKRKQMRLGPDPEDFFPRVWKNCLKFTKKNKGLAYRTAVAWTLTLTLALCCFRTAQWCFQNEYDAIMANASNQGVTITSSQILINGTNDSPAEYMDNKYRRKVVLPGPSILAHRSPPVVFWRLLGIAFQLGFGGWAIFLTTVIVKATMAGESKLKRVQSDFFANITMGMRFYLWPWFVFVPFSLLPLAWAGWTAQQANGVLDQSQQIALGVSAGAVYLLSLFLVPAAAVHMSQKHTYPAWLLVPMVRAFFRTALPSVALTGMILLTCVSLPAAVAGGAAAGWPQLKSAFADVVKLVSDNIGIGGGNGFFDFGLVQLPLFGLAVGLSLMVIFLIVGFPAIYMMRAIGLYGLYFRDELGLVVETSPGEPAGFGPRYLAFQVDMLVCSLFSVVAGLAYLLFSFSMVPSMAGPLAGVVFALVVAAYFVIGECGQARATPGKWSLGLMVFTEKGTPMDRKTGIRRVACAVLTVLTLFAGFLMCLFDPEKRALHDKLSHTKVVWKGDDERSE